MEKKVDVAIIGAGSAGLYALSQVRRATNSFVLIDGGELGTTCARVGCMPSKALIQVAEDFHRRGLFEREGIEGGAALSLAIPDAMEHVRDLRDTFVDKVLSTSTDNMGDELIRDYAEFIEPNLLKVGNDTIRAARVIIATGSRPLIPAAWKPFREFILTSDTLFEQERLPESLAVVGLGVIGLELGQALHRMGTRVVGLDRLATIGGLEDPMVNEVAVDVLGKEFPLWLGHPADLEIDNGKIRVSSADNSILVDKVFASMGRVPNIEQLGLDRLGIPTDDRGIPRYNPNTMQVGDYPIFIAGDVTADRPILHEAGDEGRIAGLNAVRSPVTAFKRKTPLAITFCDPNIVTVGARWSDIQCEHTVVGEMRLGPVGRALIMGKNKGLLRVYGDGRNGRILGASMLGPRAENLGHLLAWAIQQNLTVVDLLRMPFYHPVIEEALQAALYDLYAKTDVKTDDPVELRRF